MTSRLRYTLISFDLDGTLIDTAPEIADAANLTLEGLGRPPRPLAEVAALIGSGARTLMLELLNASTSGVHTSDVESALQQFEAHYLRCIGTRSQPYPGAIAGLHRLRQHGLKLACVTNKASCHTARVLAAHGMERGFDLVISGDSLPVKKPHRAVLQHVAQALGCEPAAIAHVGDSAVDVAAARNAGVAAWAVPYGYNGGRPVADAAPDMLFSDLAAMAEHVLASSAPRAATHRTGR